MADNQFSVRVPSIYEALLAGDKGYESGRQFRQDQALQAAGPDFAAGNYPGALARLMQSGNLQGALAVANMANNNRDFQFRQTEAQRAQGNTDRTFNEQQRQFNLGVEGGKVPAGFERTPQGLRPIPGGPQDPTYIQETRKGPQISVGDITKLSEEGGKYSNINGFIGSFKPGYAGKPFGIGEASNYVARNLPSALTGEEQRDAAGWWQSYDRYKNVVRNDLFGSALTANEQAAFEKADINPGMNPDLVNKNLEIQKKIVEQAIVRKAGALVQAGHDPAVIAKAYGIDLKSLGVQPRAQAAQPQAPQMWTDPATNKTYKIINGVPHE